MKKNRFIVAGMLAVLLTFGLVLAGCDNGTPGVDKGNSEKEPPETLPELPSSKGPNEVGGKTYTDSLFKWVFNADGTYTHSAQNNDNWIVEDSGRYLWDSSGAFKTLTLDPQLANYRGELYDKAGWKTAALSTLPPDMTDTTVTAETEGTYTTVTAYINAFADRMFAHNLCTYTIDAEKNIDTFADIGRFGFSDTKGGKVIVHNETASVLTVVTYKSGEKTFTVPVGTSTEVFAATVDTFLEEMEIRSTGGFTGIGTDRGYNHNVQKLWDTFFSYKTGPFGVAGGEILTFTVFDN